MIRFSLNKSFGQATGGNQNFKYFWLVASSAILRILLSDIGWLPVAGLLKPIVLIDLFMPQRTQENQPIDLAVRNNTTYHTADGIKISNMFG